jgi:hypothetical protein
MARISIPDLNPSIPDLQDLSQSELKITGGKEESSPKFRHDYDDDKKKKKKKK